MDASARNKLLVGAAIVGAAWLAYRPSPRHVVVMDAETEALAAEELIEVVSTGEEVDLGEHLEEGRYTVVAFGADW